MNNKKYNKIYSIFLVFLLSISLIVTPLQSIAYAEVNEDQVTNEQDEQEINNNDSSEEAEEVPAEGSDEADASEDGAATDEVAEEPVQHEDAESESTETEDTEVEVEQDEQVDFDYESFNLEINSEMETTSNSIGISWEVNQDVVKEFNLYLDYELVETLPADTYSYTFTDLNPGEDYQIRVEAVINEYDSFNSYYSVTAEWSIDEMVPVSIITMLNDDPDYSDYIRIRGSDDANKNFNIEHQVLYGDSDLYLPLGKYKVTIYNDDDPSIAATETIEIKEGIDYINNPIQLKYRLKEMREEAEPFEFDITKVTNNSFTIAWNEVSKITGVKFYAWWDDPEDYHYLESNMIDKSLNEFTFENLYINSIYNIEFVTDYLDDLKKSYSFNLKTNGEDANAPKVNIADKEVRDNIAKTLGVYFRDVTEADMNGLTELWIDHSNIDSLQGLEHAVNLVRLDAVRNNISDITSLQGLPNLETVYLDSNNISNIDALANSLLVNLYLYNNNISDVSALKNITSLHTLNLASNDITSITDLVNLTDLQELLLDDNKVTDISSLKGLKNLEYLSLYSNEITNIDALADLTQLRDLSISYNNINDIKVLKNFSKLNYLSASSNNIVNIDSLANLSELERVYLHYNKITDISSLKGLKNLTELDLSSNEITDISGLSNLSELETLYLSYNKISSIPSLKGLDNLTELSLYRNEITDISGLAGLDSLTYLDLDDNNITDISVLKELPSLQTVYLYGNDITDTDTIQWLRNEGVEVYYDEEDSDWNDWEDGDEGDDEDAENNREEVLQSFPEEQGFVVSDDGKQISIDLSKKTTEEKFGLTKEQIKMLIENKQTTLELSRGEVKAAIPASAFDNYDEPVEISINEIKSDPNSLSNTYDFTVKQGTRTISQFDEGVTLTFNVNADRAKDPNNLKVFYKNEETGKWENVGGTYSNGTVTVAVYHFSIYTVFEAVDETSDEIEPVDTPEETEKPSGNEEDSPEEETIPDTNLDVTPGEGLGSIDNNKTNQAGAAADKTVTVQDENKTTATVDGTAQSDNEATDKAGNLPATATNIYNLLLIGTLLVFGGLSIFLYNRKRTRIN